MLEYIDGSHHCHQSGGDLSRETSVPSLQQDIICSCLLSQRLIIQLHSLLNEEWAVPVDIQELQLTLFSYQDRSLWTFFKLLAAIAMPVHRHIIGTGRWEFSNVMGFVVSMYVHYEKRKKMRMRMRRVGVRSRVRMPVDGTVQLIYRELYAHRADPSALVAAIISLGSSLKAASNWL